MKKTNQNLKLQFQKGDIARLSGNDLSKIQGVPSDDTTDSEETTDSLSYIVIRSSLKCLTFSETTSG